MTQIRVTVDGDTYTDDVEPRMLLVHYLREQVGKIGTVVGCDTSNCGACTVHLDGEAVKSCSVFAVQADGSEITTIEGISRNGDLHPMQKAFHEMHGACAAVAGVAADDRADLAQLLAQIVDEEHARLDVVGVRGPVDRHGDLGQFPPPPRCRAVAPVTPARQAESGKGNRT